jgi:hypothetical protein
MMGTTATQSSKLAMVPNVPERFTIKYIDVYPGKVKDGKTFSAQVRLKGTHNGADAVCYMNGAVWAAVKALVAGGVIDPGQYNEDPQEAYSIPVVTEDVILLREQQAGQKYPEWVIRPADGSAPAPRPAATAPAPNAKQPHTSGGFIAGLDDADERQFVNRVTEQPTARTAEAPFAVPQQIVERYRACLKQAVSLAMTELEPKGVKCDGPTVQALAATLMIQWSRG